MVYSNVHEESKTFNMKAISNDTADVESVAVADSTGVLEAKERLPGLVDLDSIQCSWSLQNLIVIWISALLMSFATSLNNQTANSFVSYATSDFSSAPLLGTIIVVQSVASTGW